MSCGRATNRLAILKVNWPTRRPRFRDLIKNEQSKSRSSHRRYQLIPQRRENYPMHSDKRRLAQRRSIIVAQEHGRFDEECRQTEERIAAITGTNRGESAKNSRTTGWRPSSLKCSLRPANSNCRCARLSMLGNTRLPRNKKSRWRALNNEPRCCGSRWNRRCEASRNANICWPKCVGSLRPARCRSSNSTKQCASLDKRCPNYLTSKTAACGAVCRARGRRTTLFAASGLHWWTSFGHDASS